MHDDSERGVNGQEGALFLGALRVALGRAPLWLVTWTATLALALPLATTWYSYFASATSNRYEPGTLVHHLSETFRLDHGAELGSLNSGTARAGSVLIVIAALLGIFAAGGWLQVILERSHGHSLRSFFYGGARHFWRFFRFWILTGVVLAGLHWLLYGWPWKFGVLETWLGVPKRDFEQLETLDSELLVRRLGWLRDGLAALGFVLILAWGTFARTRLALHNSRSAVWAGIASCGVLLRHPIKTLRPLIMLGLTELLLVTLVAGGLVRWLDGWLTEDPGFVTVVLILVIGQLALVWREVTRGARYVVAARVSQEVLRPHPAAEPWPSIGGPGGPQYPVGEVDDEFGVSV